jgi:hypothetical protein
MANKVKPAAGWPVVKGEYDAGNPENPVAVSTCGSHLKGAAQISPVRKKQKTLVLRKLLQISFLTLTSDSCSSQVRKLKVTSQVKQYSCFTRMVSKITGS